MCRRAFDFDAALYWICNPNDLFFTLHSSDAKTWEYAKINLGNLYSTAPPIEDFYLWQDERVIDECYWYG